MTVWGFITQSLSLSPFHWKEFATLRIAPILEAMRNSLAFDKHYGSNTKLHSF